MVALDQCMDRFAVASRELFNNYFRLHQPWSDPNAAWDSRDLYEPVRQALFTALVITPNGLSPAAYGDPQPDLLVAPRSAETPIMLNRERSSGYWDHPVTTIDPSATLRFVRFFDWADIERMDHAHVMVEVAAWPGTPELEGKLGLIEAHHVRFIQAEAHAGRR